MCAEAVIRVDSEAVSTLWDSAIMATSGAPWPDGNDFEIDGHSISRASFLAVAKPELIAALVAGAAAGTPEESE